MKHQLDSVLDRNRSFNKIRNRFIRTRLYCGVQVFFLSCPIVRKSLEHRKPVVSDLSEPTTRGNGSVKCRGGGARRRGGGQVLF